MRPGDDERVTRPEAKLPHLCRSRSGWRVGAALCLVALSVVPAAAQSSWWPFSNSEPPRPPAPIYRAPPAPIPPAATLPPPIQPQAGRNNSGGPICVQLEQRLVAEGQRGNQGRNQGPKIDEEIRQTERAAGQAQNQLERGDCYEFFLFSKTLRRTPQCVQAASLYPAPAS
jgi:multidrug efflux pump subunit AcrA (membrane-fusion protein)